MLGWIIPYSIMRSKMQISPLNQDRKYFSATACSFQVSLNNKINRTCQRSFIRAGFTVKSAGSNQHVDRRQSQKIWGTALQNNFTNDFFFHSFVHYWLHKWTVININPHLSFIKLVLFYINKCKCWLNCMTIFL